MADQNETQAAQWEAALQQDPSYQRLLADRSMDERTRSGRLQAFFHTRFPDAQGWHVDPMNGRLRQASNGGWKYVGIAAALAVTGGALGGALAAPAAAAGAGAEATVPGVVGGTLGADLAANTAAAVAPTSGGLFAAGTGPGMVAGSGITPALGAAGTYLDRAGQVSDALNGLNSGLQHGREAETNATQTQDRNAISRYGAETNAARLNLAAPQARGQTSVQGDILANAKPFSWTGQTKMVGNIPVPQSTGGLSPDVFSDNTRTLGKEMSANALTDNRRLGGDAIGPAPPLTPPAQAGTGSRILSGASTALNIWNAYRGRTR